MKQLEEITEALQVVLKEGNLTPVSQEKVVRAVTAVADLTRNNPDKLYEDIHGVWSGVSDFDTLLFIIEGLEINPTDGDVLMNMVIGMQSLFEARCTKLMDTFEGMSHV